MESMWMACRTMNNQGFTSTFSLRLPCLQVLRISAVLGQVLDVRVDLVLCPAPVDPLVGPEARLKLRDLEGLPRGLNLLSVVPYEDEPVHLQAVVGLHFGKGGNLSGIGDFCAAA